MIRSLLLTGLILLATLSWSQTTCTTLGQTPSTAFPVCGTSTFTQSTVPICGGRNIPAPTCQGGGYTDKNPFWYKFTCFQSGTLQFVITPNDMNEDYDWQLFDVTNKDVNDVYTDQTMIISYNWSGLFGVTGATPAGGSLFSCGGSGQPLFSKPAFIEAGHNYILLVSHFSNSQSGYSLSFGGGSAVITDTTPPALSRADANCAGNVIRVKLNKKMKCSTIAANGSDFFLSPASANIVSAAGINCNTGFETDSIELTLNNPLPDGAYQLRVKSGTDGNTLLDLCDNGLPVTEVAGFSVAAGRPTPMDSLTKPGCAPQSLRLVFSRPIQCASISPSDFLITGSYPVNITSVEISCSGTATRQIVVRLSAPMEDAGNFLINLQRGSDGNTLINECNQESPPGSIAFSVADTVNASFTYSKFYGCTEDTVQFSHPGGNGINSWHWFLDDNKTSMLQNPQVFYTLFNNKQVRLAVSNGVCVDTSDVVVALDNFIKADFTVHEDNCPNEPVQFTSTSIGNIKQHSWQFGDGGTATSESPTYTYPPPFQLRNYSVIYTVRDSIGCEHSVSKKVLIYPSCYLAVPSAFTPNNDGKNDTFFPANAIKAENLKFMIYNRWGNLVFSSSNWKQGWDGTFKGSPLATGVYVWMLSYTERDSKLSRQQKGTVLLIR
jgi:gliding motility-associated-like protein